jgi:hypothetical protein
VEEAKQKNIMHIQFSPIDFSVLGFIEGARRDDSSGQEVLEEYVSRLLLGKLSPGAEGRVFNLPPEDMASLVNTVMSENPDDEAYERVITGYLKRKDKESLSKESIEKFVPFIEALRPDMKRQFLSRSSNLFTEDVQEVEKIVKDLKPESLEKMTTFFEENESILPKRLKNLVDKLSAIKKEKDTGIHFSGMHTTFIDDIELSEDVMKLFGEDNVQSYVSEDYQKDLETMLTDSALSGISLDSIRSDFSDKMVDRISLSIIFELLESDFMHNEDYLALLTKLSDYIIAFIETGRFEEILETYNLLSSHALRGRFSHQATSMLEYFFRSEEFISQLVDTLRIWGRQDREGALRLSRALMQSLSGPLMEALAEETDASIRKFFLSILSELGTDIMPYVITRLKDDRWYIVRNMIYLVRESNAQRYVDHIKIFAKHNNPIICIEAVKTLLHFNTPDAVPYLKLYLKSKNNELRNKALRLAGLYKIRETMPDLLSMLNKKVFLGVEYDEKAAVVTALGEIGDPRAVPSLMNVYRQKSVLYRKYLENLKTEIFRSLENYPEESVRPLIELGRTSWNKEIRMLCEEVSVKHSANKEKRND